MDIVTGQIDAWTWVLSSFVRFIEDTRWPNHPAGLAFVQFSYVTLSLEKNAPSDSASVMYLVLALFRFSSGLGISNRRNAVGEDLRIDDDMATEPAWREHLTSMRKLIGS